MKLYEIEYESIPSVVLQLYVILVTYSFSSKQDEDQLLTLMASIGVTVISVSYSIFKLFDKNAKHYKYSRQSTKSLIQLTMPQFETLAKSADSMLMGARGLQLTDANAANAVSIPSETPSHGKWDKSLDLMGSIDSNVSVDKAFTYSPSMKSVSSVGSVYPIHSSVEKEYSLLFRFVIYLFLVSDFYCRVLPLTYFWYVIRIEWRYFEYNNFDTNSWNFAILIILISVHLVMIVSLIIYETFIVEWMRKPGFKQTNHVKRHIFVSIFSSIVNLLLVLPLRRFVQKNFLQRYDFNHVCMLVCVLQLIGFNLYMYRFTIGAVWRSFFNIVWHAILLILCVFVVNREKYILWALHYAFWVCVFVNMTCLAHIFRELTKSNV